MKKPIPLALPLFGLIALFATGSLALAAKPLAPVPGVTPGTGEPQQLSGKIDFLDLGKNLIVIDDREYLLSSTITVNGKSGARYSLSRGMRVTYSVSLDNGRPVISEIRTGQ